MIAYITVRNLYRLLHISYIWKRQTTKKWFALIEKRYHKYFLPLIFTFL